jgi:hypothetical protein
MIDKTRYTAEYQFSLRVLSFYSRLVPADPEAFTDAGLGGKLLYAGALDEEVRALIAAANITGAASLCVTADALAQKRAVHDGVVDFLVTSLDEALRILKNEIRKGDPVAVCIAAEPSEIEAQMCERGVVPDLLRPSHEENPRATPADVALVSWSVSSNPARWMPKLDGFAQECAAELSRAARRWLSMSPRYFGRLAQSIHLVLADRGFAEKFIAGAMALEGGRIPLKLQFSYVGGAEEFNAPNWNKEDAVVPSP